MALELTLEEAPLDFFTHSGKIFWCCANGVYTNDQKEIVTLADEFSLSDDDDDEQPMDLDFDDTAILIKRPRIDHTKKELTLVYKYKKPATAFCVWKNNLYSLHTKKQGVSYVECTDISNGFHCKQSNVAMLHYSPAVECQHDSWLEIVPYATLNSEFVHTYVSNQVHESSLVIFVRVYYGQTKMVAVHPDSLQAVTDLVSCPVQCPVELFRLQTQRWLLNNQPCSKEDHLGTLESKINFILSQQKVKLGNLMSSTRAQDLLDVKSFHQGFLLLKRNGKLWQYCRKGRDLAKTCLPFKAVWKLFVQANTKCTVVDQLGRVYQFTLPYEKQERDKSGEEKKSGDDVLQDIQCASQQLSATNGVLKDREETLKQINQWLTIDGLNGSKLFDTRICVAKKKTMDHVLSVRMKNESQFSFCGQYWKLQLTLASGSNKHEQTYEIMDSFPRHFSTNSTWTCFDTLPDTLLCVEKLPLLVKGRLVLNICIDDQDSCYCVRSKVVFEKQLNTTDFSVLQSSLDQGDDDFYEEVDGDVSFDALLEKLNLARPLHGLAAASNTAKMMRTDYLELNRDNLERHQDKIPFFAHLLISGTSSILSFDLFGRLFTVVLSQAEANVRLTISSKDGNVLAAVKNDLVGYKRQFLSQSECEHVKIPVDLFQKALEIKHQLESMDDTATDENWAMLEKCYQYVRENISSKLP